MVHDTDDHCWLDVMPPAVLRYVPSRQRELSIGPAPALLAIDLYEQVYRGGNVPLEEAIKADRLSCGEYAFAAMAPTKRLFAAARAARLPIFYSTGDVNPASRPASVGATHRGMQKIDPADYAIRPEFQPQPGDVVISKQRASVFYGTPIAAHLLQLGVRSLIICGESTSGCVRASAVEAQEHGFHVVVVEECCFDRNPVCHKVNLFDLHQKYADVMHIDAVVEQLNALPKQPEVHGIR